MGIKKIDVCLQVREMSLIEIGRLAESLLILKDRHPEITEIKTSVPEFEILTKKKEPKE